MAQDLGDEGPKVTSSSFEEESQSLRLVMEFD